MACSLVFTDIVVDHAVRRWFPPLIAVDAARHHIDHAVVTARVILVTVIYRVYR